VLKFGPEGGSITAAPGEWLPTAGSKTRQPAKITGLKASFSGMGPFGKGCTCQTARMDLDGFDRAFTPVYHLSTVVVLDANFNRVARIGNYGNCDNQGPRSACPQPEIGLGGPCYVTVSDRSLYILDGPNCRILRAELGYEVEQEITLP
jgi:hypothetical protein